MYTFEKTRVLDTSENRQSALHDDRRRDDWSDRNALSEIANSSNSSSSRLYQSALHSANRSIVNDSTDLQSPIAAIACTYAYGSKFALVTRKIRNDSRQS